jgi:hypothetical protein
MILKKVSKMGKNMRVVYLPPTDYRAGQLVVLRPRRNTNNGIIITKNVSKMGKHRVVVIPKAMWAYFPAGKWVSIAKMIKVEARK